MGETSIGWEDRGESRWIRLAGELDHGGCASVADRFKSATEGGLTEVVVDMEAVTFLASHGIRLLLEAHQRLVPRGGRIHLYRPREQARRTLKMTGIDTVLREWPGEAEA